MGRAVGVFVVLAKEPRPGLVKTRLCPPLTYDQAADLYACMLADVLSASAAIAERLSLLPVLAVHPAEACRELSRLAPATFRVIRQRGATLSQRMEWAAAEVAAAGAQRILLRGSDSPLMDEEVVSTALAQLEEVDLSLSPDRDGGYNLVGLRAPAWGLFDHPMSTETVRDDTVSNARRLGLSTRFGMRGFDIDTVRDLRQLIERCPEENTELCPRSIEFLREDSICAALNPG